MKYLKLGLISLLTFGLSAYAGDVQEQVSEKSEKISGKAEKEAKQISSAIKGELNRENVEQHISEWSEPSKKAADFMINKYGLPTGVSDSTLVWEDSKPFKRSIVYKEAITHNFPMEHKDVLEQVVDYKAPRAEQAAKVWEYDGSVFLKRTPGEMSAMCDAEAANFLALNLANEIINGERSVEEARTEYAQQIVLFKNDKPTDYTQKLKFDVAAQAGDPDESIMDRIDQQKVLAE
ncbi:MAG: hypothetical protein WEB87_00435 [Bacteriovoracaceae bacterium]